MPRRFSGGYSLPHAYDASAYFRAGWFVSLGGNVNPWFGLGGEVSGSYRTLDVQGTKVILNQYSCIVGPNRMTFFGQTLSGAARSAARGTDRFGSASETDFTVQPGGGVDLNITGRLGVRLGVNYQFISANAPNCCLPHSGKTGRELQVLAGFVVPN